MASPGTLPPAGRTLSPGVAAVGGVLAGLLAGALAAWLGARGGVPLAVAAAVASAAVAWRLASLGGRPGSSAGDGRSAATLDRGRVEETWCRIVASATGDLMALLDDEGRVLQLSPSAERKLDLRSPTEARGRGLASLLGPKDGPLAASLVAEALRAGHSHGVVRAFGNPGPPRWYELVMDATDAQGRRVIAVLGRDVTEQRMLAGQLQQAQKMEAMGRLAGGVAHDFNNVLTIIRSGAMLARETLPTGHPAHVDLADISAAADRAAALTRQLLAFARGNARRDERSDAEDVLSSLGVLLPRAVGGGVRILVDVGPGLGEIPLGATSLEQVVLNLVINARDAMPSGGRVRLSARRREARPGDGSGLAPGPVVEIAVSDEGTGMDDSVRSHVFEPFFTTKGAGGGTGLGLSTSLGIVREAGGNILVESVPGKGSTFRVLVPRTGGGGEAETLRAAPRGRKVLLVDRDPAFVALATRQLAAHGLQAWVAASVSEARQMAASEPGTVDVLVVDLSLGEEHGIEAVGEVRRTNPGARVVLLSGEVRDEADVDHLLDAGIEVVRKPVPPEVLVEAVERVLHREAHEAGKLLHA
jgi:two-component system, cell cycle sensor histidine kinase and response regulator CckA